MKNHYVQVSQINSNDDDDDDDDDDEYQKANFKIRLITMLLV